MSGQRRNGVLINQNWTFFTRDIFCVVFVAFLCFVSLRIQLRNDPLGCKISRKLKLQSLREFLLFSLNAFVQCFDETISHNALLKH